MVKKFNSLLCLNLLGFTIVIILLIQTAGSPEWLILIIIIILVIMFIDYLILGGAYKITKSIQYKLQKTFTCPKCYTKIEKRERVFCPNCGNKI
ncbi:MAG: hypothetical protein ACXACO_21560 [Promethearchaeota archaeon]